MFNKAKTVDTILATFTEAAVELEQLGVSLMTKMHKRQDKIVDLQAANAEDGVEVERCGRAALKIRSILD